MKAVHSWVMTKEAMRERVLEWLTPYRGGEREWGEDPGKFENLCILRWIVMIEKCFSWRLLYTYLTIAPLFKFSLFLFISSERSEHD